MDSGAHFNPCECFKNAYAGQGIISIAGESVIMLYGDLQAPARLPQCGRSISVTKIFLNMLEPKQH